MTGYLVVQLSLLTTTSFSSWLASLYISGLSLCMWRIFLYSIWPDKFWAACESHCPSVCTDLYSSPSSFHMNRILRLLACLGAGAQPSSVDSGNMQMPVSFDGGVAIAFGTWQSVCPERQVPGGPSAISPCCGMCELLFPDVNRCTVICLSWTMASVRDHLYLLMTACSGFLTSICI